ncbi:helix-turn-helix domain-containing protein [Candidatus Woesearchaeota archaeon]|nr:helix-turn-helix domain-containing protein [Candidatus Woesearchaeota archaeon]MBI2131055.1 helix-turn-helix domain-containing protein [Candidatus Woesearchaeota archaeon]
MSDLGDYLRQSREHTDRSRRWVERQSRELYPDDTERQISFAYLRQIEEGRIRRPNPLKLQTLARIYGVDYMRIYSIAGYLDDEMQRMAARASTDGLESNLETVMRMNEFLESRGIVPEDFIRNLMLLSPNSFHIISDLLRVLQHPKE